MKTLIRSINRSPLRCSFFTITIALCCFALVQNTQAVSPAPDGGYPGANTAEGTDALFSLTSGIANTAVGLNALHDNTTGGFNVAVGSCAPAPHRPCHLNIALGRGRPPPKKAQPNLRTGFPTAVLNPPDNALTASAASALPRENL